MECQRKMAATTDQLTTSPLIIMATPEPHAHETETKKCAQCHARKSLSHFKVSKKTNAYGPRCQPCMKQDAERKREKRKQTKKRMLVEILSDAESDAGQEWPAMEWNTFLEGVKKQSPRRLAKKDPKSFVGTLRADVDCTNILDLSHNLKTRAQTISKELGESMGLHWTYVLLTLSHRSNFD